MAGPFARLRRGGDAGADSPTVDAGPDAPDDADTNPTAEMTTPFDGAPPTATIGDAQARREGAPPAAGDTEILPAIAPVGATASEVIRADAAPVAGETEPATALDAEAPADQPADTEPAAEPAAPTFLSRGRMRRRLRHVRRAREIALRDLGGLVFDLHRFGRDRGDLVDQKLAALSALDAEMRALAHALDDPDDITVLREPGLASCARCGALHGSDAQFCSTCGLPVGKGAGLPAGPTFAGPAPSPAAPPPAAPPPAAPPPAGPPTSDGPTTHPS